MRRADRLFQIIQYIRSRQVTTACWLAERLEVSERTIYRDIQDLIISGVPIEGEAGVGYIMRKGFDFPPLMFSADEIAALCLGARLVQSWADRDLASAAQQALNKIQYSLPDGLRNEISSTPLFSPMVRIPPEVADLLAGLRLAINKRMKTEIIYQRADGEISRRVICPLGLFFWGKVWTLGAWCEKRNMFRNFRVDRIQFLTRLADSFALENERSLEKFFEFIKKTHKQECSCPINHKLFVEYEFN